MTPEEIEPYFTRQDGGYVFARWGRPIAPIVFGVEEPSLSVIKGALEAIVVLANHKMAETDPEFGANLMLFFLRDWDELRQVPDLDRLVPDLADLTTRLAAEDASQYRFFRFDKDGAIKAAFGFVRMRGAMADMPADTMALTQAVQMTLLWSQGAFADRSPLAVLNDGTCVLRPEIADLIRVAYDPILPVAAKDHSHALRLAARLTKPAP